MHSSHCHAQHRCILGQKHGRITLRKASSNAQKKVRKREDSYSTDVEQFIESGGTDSSDRFQAMTVTETRSPTVFV